MVGWFGLTTNQQSYLRGALYNAWNSGEPNNNNGNEGCAVLDFDKKNWNDVQCDLGGNGAPYVLCQRARYLKNDLS